MTQQHKHLIVRADIGWCPQEEDLNKISQISDPDFSAITPKSLDSLTLSRT